MKSGKCIYIYIYACITLFKTKIAWLKTGNVCKYKHWSVCFECIFYMISDCQSSNTIFGYKNIYCMMCGNNQRNHNAYILNVGKCTEHAKIYGQSTLMLLYLQNQMVVWNPKYMVVDICNEAI